MLDNTIHHIASAVGCTLSGPGAQGKPFLPLGNQKQSQKPKRVHLRELNACRYTISGLKLELRGGFPATLRGAEALQQIVPREP